MFIYVYPIPDPNLKPLKLNIDSLFMYIILIDRTNHRVDSLNEKLMAT